MLELCRRGRYKVRLTMDESDDWQLRPDEGDLAPDRLMACSVKLGDVGARADPEPNKYRHQR